jgi:DNA invertase Pin-like site-specific DNA recombinase
MTPIDPFALGRPAKIQSRHLERLAVIYVRQSQRHQVLKHKESAEVQANLWKRALAWGWPEERILVLDGDQGRSGLTTHGRDDFAWLLSEIALDHVGLVFGFQINRLAREDEACCRLIKLCGGFDTLLADQDGLYHPHDFNDRLILTIKGFMGGIELHQLQQRMQAGRLNRCRRGEWMGQPPPGYILGPERRLQLDLDEQVQHVVRLIFEEFTRLGSVSGVLRHLRQQQIQLPFRPQSASQSGRLLWHVPHRETVRKLLRHPAYAGAYTWGRNAVDPHRKVPGQRGHGRKVTDPEACAVFLRDNHPAYITWEQYQSNLQRLKQQRQHGPVPGPRRTTVAVAAGLVVCGLCGRRMQTRYRRLLRYSCEWGALDYAAARCQSFAGASLEQLVQEQILQVVTPASLALSQRAAQECERQRVTLDRQWRLRLERACQDADRASRQYDAVEPENRLVARSLERAWEKAMLAQRALEEEYDRFRQTQSPGLTAAQRSQIDALAKDLPKLWNSPQTSVVDKRRVARLLLQRIVVWAPASSQQAKVQLHWAGGVVTEHQILHTLGSWNQLPDFKTLLEQLRQWHVSGWTSRRIAEELNRQGRTTPRGNPFTRDVVRQLLSRTARRQQKSTKKRRRVDSAR